jgi:glutamyl-Q tRNA(Asp) synthetase
VDAYQDALRSLRQRGFLYRCFRTRAEVLERITAAPHGPQPPAVGGPLPADEEARRLAEGRPYAWRLSLGAAERALGGFSGLSFTDADRGPIAADPWRAGDVVLARKDLGIAYHLAVVVDDAFQGVTEVIRGEDLREACHIQRLLQALLDLPTPRYCHHRLVLGADGRRLAKRDRGETLRALRESGVTPAQLRQQLLA